MVWKPVKILDYLTQFIKTNKIGIENAKNKYNQNNPIDENTIANNIVNGMKYKRSLSA